MEARRFIRLRELASTHGKPGMIPASPATIWRWVRAGRFPAPVKLSDRVTVWETTKVEAFLSQATGGTQ